MKNGSYKVNPVYWYQDHNMWWLLNLRAQQEGFTNTIVMPPIGEVNQLTEQLAQEAQRNESIPNRTLLIPYNIGNLHWIGIVIQIVDNQIQTRTYYDSTPEQNGTLISLLVTLKRFEEAGLVLEKGDGLTQLDDSSCGPLTIENLINAARNQLVTGEIYATLIRQQHISIMENYHPEARFYTEQLYNTPAVAKGIRNIKVKKEMSQNDKEVLEKIIKTCNFIQRIYEKYKLTPEMLNHNHLGYRAFFLLELSKAPSYWPEEYKDNTVIAEESVSERLIADNPVRYIWGSLNNISELVKQLSWDVKNGKYPGNMFWQHLELLSEFILNNSDPIINQAAVRLLQSPENGIAFVKATLEAVLAGKDSPKNENFNNVVGYYYSKIAISDIYQILKDLNENLGNRTALQNSIAIFRVIQKIGEYLKAVPQSILDLANLPERGLFSNMRDIISHAKAINYFQLIKENRDFEDLLPALQAELSLLEQEFRKIEAIIKGARDLDALYTSQGVAGGQLDWEKLKEFSAFLEKNLSLSEGKVLGKFDLDAELKQELEKLGKSHKLPSQAYSKVKKLLEQLASDVIDDKQSTAEVLDNFHKQVTAFDRLPPDKQQVLNDLADTINHLLQEVKKSISSIQGTTALKFIKNLCNCIDVKAFNDNLAKLKTHLLENALLSQPNIEGLLAQLGDLFTQRMKILKYVRSESEGSNLTDNILDKLREKLASLSEKEELEEALKNVLKGEKQDLIQNVIQKLSPIFEKLKVIKKLKVILIPEKYHADVSSGQEKELNTLMRDFRAVFKKDFDKKLDGFIERLKKKIPSINDKKLDELKVQIVKLKSELKEMEVPKDEVLKTLLEAYNVFSKRNSKEPEKDPQNLENELLGDVGKLAALLALDDEDLMTNGILDYALLHELYDTVLRDLGLEISEFDYFNGQLEFLERDLFEVVLGKIAESREDKAARAVKKAQKEITDFLALLDTLREVFDITYTVETEIEENYPSQAKIKDEAAFRNNLVEDFDSFKELHDSNLVLLRKLFDIDGIVRVLFEEKRKINVYGIWSVINYAPEEWSLEYENFGYQGLVNNFFDTHTMFRMMSTFNSVRKAINKNPSLQHTGDNLIAILAEELEALLYQYPKLQKYFDQYIDIRNFFNHPSPNPHQYLVIKSGTTYLSKDGTLAQQIEFFSLHFKFILENILQRLVVGVIEDVFEDYFDNLGLLLLEHEALDTDWLTGDQIATVGNAINNDQAIRFIPTIDAYLPPDNHGSVETMVLDLADDNAIAAVINIGNNLNVRVGAGNHWVLYFATRGADGEMHGVLLNPMGNNLYDLTLQGIQQRITGAYPGETHIEILNLGLQTDGHNCGVWVLWFLERINQLQQGGAALNEEFVQNLPDVLRQFNGDGITAKREEYRAIAEASNDSQNVAPCSEEDEKMSGEGSLKLQPEYHKLSPIDPFYNRYYKYGLDEMLVLRLKDANLQDIAMLPAFKLNIYTLQTTLSQITKKIDEGFDKVIIPCNIEGKHWIGFLFQKTVDSLKILYLDSEHGKLAVSFKNQFIEYFQGEYQEVLMIEKVVERQKYNNCGPEVIENFIKYLGKERLPQDEAVYYHSQLLEQSLLSLSMKRFLDYDDYIMTTVPSVSYDILILCQTSVSHKQSTPVDLLPLIKDVSLEEIHPNTELSLQITNQASSDNTGSIPNIGTNFIKRLNDYVEHYLKKIFLPDEFYEMQQLANKHKVDIKIVDEVTLKQAYKKIALKTHPDKYPDATEDFIKAKQLLDQKESPLPTELYAPIMQKLQKVNIIVEAADTAIDSIRAFKDPSLENVLKVGTGCIHIVSMYTGKTGVMLPIAAAGSVYQAYQGDYWEAATSMTKAIGFTLMFSTVYATAPAVAVVLSAGFTGYATYSMLNNGYELYKEYFITENNVEVALGDVNSKLTRELKIAEEQLQNKGVFSQQLYKYIYTPYIEEKHNLLNKLSNGEITQKEVEILSPKFIKIISDYNEYNICLKNKQNNGTESKNANVVDDTDYYCYDEEQQILDHVVVMDGNNLQVVEHLF